MAKEENLCGRHIEYPRVAMMICFMKLDLDWVKEEDGAGKEGSCA